MKFSGRFPLVKKILINIFLILPYYYKEIKLVI